MRPSARCLRVPRGVSWGGAVIRQKPISVCPILLTSVLGPPSRRVLSSRLGSIRTTSSSTRTSTSRQSIPGFLAVAGVTLAVALYNYQEHSTIWMDSGPEKDTKNNQDNALPITLHPASPASPAAQTSEADLAFYQHLLDAPSASLEECTLPPERAVLTSAPHVPPPITRTHPVLLQVDLTTTTKLAQLTPPYKYEQWTFNDTVPGPFIRARVGDVVELTLSNRDKSGNPHNIDSHAFTGPGGGAALTTVEEGDVKVARFKLLRPGVFLYHCAAAPVPVHIANGMYGLMYVQPARGHTHAGGLGGGDGGGGGTGEFTGDGLPPVDREYYVMQSEFYHEPPQVDDATGRLSEVVEFSYPAALREEASAVVFNGKDGAVTRDAPLKAKAGETVRIFFGNAGPNLTSSFHVIGSHFDRVYRDGDVLSPPARCVSTVGVPPGAATVVDMKMVVPGTYALVDHAIFRMDKGAVGFLNVSGPPRPDIYQSVQGPEPCVGCKLHA